MPIYEEKIRSVLNRGWFEGPQQLKGYIPCNLTNGKTANYVGGPNPERYDPMGVSGVTIATGVDLGQTDAPTLKKIGVSDSTINLLRPYLEKRKKNAVYALHNNSLTITKEIADELDRCMIGHHISIISKRYDRDAGPGAFESIPWQAQAVIVSILYQRGVNSPSKFKNTWAALIRKDWKDASQRFLNASLWAGYHGRRREEGKLLGEIV
ncbi:MAG: hypothetical protein IJU40_01500 [Desulfovibrionaceae bacterium]|nr:hypothetical protein [Desulfovibrionaceae bacterium]